MDSNNRLTRKIIHLFTGLALFVLTLFLQRNELLTVIVAGSVFAFITYPLKAFRILHHTRNGSLGTLFYPLGVLTAFLLLYNQPIYYFQVSLLILTVSDTSANLAGRIKRGNVYFNTFKEEKSFYGVVAFAITAYLVYLLLLPTQVMDSFAFVTLALLLAVTFEVISHKGSDNFSIPAGSALFFLVMQQHDGAVSPLLAIVVISAAGAYLLFRMGFLSKMAAVAVYFLGVYFIGVLGWQWATPVLFFFFTSVALTRASTFSGRLATHENRRNTWQVLANILWALLASVAYLVTQEEVFLYLYVALVAAVTADTWASVTGPLFHRRSFSLADMAMRASGVSGGITFAGTLASLTGSFLVAYLGGMLLFDTLSAGMIVAIALSGFLAGFVDSFLGAFAEKPMTASRWFRKQAIKKEALSPNDVVNLMGSLTAPVFFILLRMLIT